ncbi:hypothetical protein AB0L63_19415 [Nocardia sp. NPDC051990]|uniref:hypothetical protein n=1 Tax=Nocardia sp. NPDC051990 TaxID=3155285 RepID=UPI00343B64C9
MKSPRRVRHIHIESGPLVLDFQGSAEQISSVAAQLAAAADAADLTFTVDNEVGPHLPELPCGGLWE